MTGLVLDTGAFIALERRDKVMTALAAQAAKDEIPLVTSAGVVAQVWRGGGGAQVPVVFLLRRTRVVDLTHRVAKILGRLLAARGARDVVDAHVAFLAKERDWPVLTSDPVDLRALDPTLRLQRV
jgi:hypothetical protein